MAIDYAKAYQKFIDEELCASSITQWMVPTAGQVKYEGGKNVLISTLSTTGLGDYAAEKTDGSAYPAGAVTNTWNTYELSMDRGVKFALDRTDPSDSGFMTTAENVMREFARVQLTREQDIYRINKLYNLVKNSTFASKNVKAAVITKTNAISELMNSLSAVQNSSEQLSGFVAIVNQELKGAFLEAATGTYNNVTFGNKIEVNGIAYENVMIVNDLPCVFAPSARMQTVISANTGRAEGDVGGIVAATDSKKINFIITSFDAPLAVSKIDSLKQFGPNENQLFDGTAIQARYLYDLFVQSGKVSSIAAHTVA